VGSLLDDLPTGATVATGSARRRAQLAHLRPDLTFAPLRGNIETRIEKAAGFDAAVMSYAALLRSGRADAAAEALDPAVMLPQVGQGALAVECRAGDDATLEALAGIDSPEVRSQVTAERGFLAELGGDCTLPAGALAKFEGGSVSVEVLLASPDGRVVLRHTATGADPESTGRRAARELLDEHGGRMLLPAEVPS
ncbi:MAG: hydroxymethylbilane synthase, partial [Actinobacteria bacterium]|nr:hydroxymethylbilane synthase [Actinomycetota bacterium]